jgi:hypothetical protein
VNASLSSILAAVGFLGILEAGNSFVVSYLGCCNQVSASGVADCFGFCHKASNSFILGILGSMQKVGHSVDSFVLGANAWSSASGAMVSFCVGG